MRRTRIVRRDGRHPMGLRDASTMLIADERAWEIPAAGRALRDGGQPSLPTLPDTSRRPDSPRRPGR
jgi:hypothetical protein